MENKFSFNENQDSGTAAKQDARSFFKNLFQFLQQLLSFRKDTDHQATLDGIRADIPFRGATAWVLICSIFLASIGLNANAPAVVIGAMLIAPLMGPVLGIGVSLAIHDVDTLRRSLLNFTVMVLLSVITATLFFAIFPLREDSSELLARTQPDIRDVLIAFFGGLALIIARTKKGTIASVIFGVAIATALMPPLCTVGYGFAQGNIGYALRALYLFFINTTFIALASFLVVRILRFPMIRYANSRKRKRISNLASLLALLVMIPAGYTFVGVLKKSRFTTAANTFLTTELNGLQYADYLKQTARIDFSEGEDPKIIINTFGLNPLEESVVQLLKTRLLSYPALTETKLVINQQERLSNIVNEQRYLKELRIRDSLDLLSKSQQIEILKNELEKVSSQIQTTIPFEEISREILFVNSNIKSLRYANTLVSNFNKIDTILYFEVIWKESIEDGKRMQDETELRNWLALKIPEISFELKSMLVDVE